MQITMTLGADCALIAVRLRIAFDLPDAPVFHGGKEGAAIPAPVANSGNTGQRGLTARLRPVPETEQAGGKGADSHGGSFQERASRYLERFRFHVAGHVILRKNLPQGMRVHGWFPGTRLFILLSYFLPLHRVTGLDPVSILRIDQDSVLIAQVVQGFGGQCGPARCLAIDVDLCVLIGNRVEDGKLQGTA